MQYELCYLVGESKMQDLGKVKEDVLKMVSKEGGKWMEPQIEEKRKMAYKVRKEVRGIYVTQRFEISKEENDEITDDHANEGAEAPRKNALESMSKKLNLYPDVLRFILVKADDLPELKIRTAPIKISAGEGRSFQKPVYSRKSEPAKEKNVFVKPLAGKVEKNEAVTHKEEIEEKKAGAEKELPVTLKRGKSIDEKIDEILNI